MTTTPLLPISGLTDASMEIVDARLRNLARSQNASLSIQYHLDKDEYHGTMVGAFGLRTSVGSLAHVVARLKRMAEQSA